MARRSRTKVILLIVLLLVVGLGIGVAGAGIWFVRKLLLARDAPPPALRVTAHYPGASAEEVERIVAVPLEVQLSGMEGLDTIESISRDDGVTLTLYLRPGTDLEIAQVLAQNRVSLALPTLPDVVKQQGIAVVKGGPLPALWLLVDSPDQSRDQLHLHNLAAMMLAPEVTALPGVTGVSAGRGGPRLCLFLDSAKLAARNLTPADVLTALREAEVMKEADQPRDFAGEGRLAVQLRQVMVKASANGRAFPLCDVADLEMGPSGPLDRAHWHGHLAAPLAVSGGDPGRLFQDISNRLPDLRKSLTRGTDLHLLPGPFVPGTDALLVEGRLPGGASEERLRVLVDRTIGDLGQITDARAAQLIPAVVELPTEEPAAFRLYVALCPAGERALTTAEISDRARQVLADIPELMGRVTSPAVLARPPHLRAPLVLIVRGESVEDMIRLADTIRERLGKSGVVTDLWADYAGLAPRLSNEVDREKVRAFGVHVKDVMDTLQTVSGSLDMPGVDIGGANGVRVCLGRGLRGRPEVPLGALGALQVRADQGQVVALKDMVQIRLVMGPASLHRINGKRCLLIDAEPAAGVSIETARRRCREIAEQVLSESKPNGCTVECP